MEFNEYKEAEKRKTDNTNEIANDKDAVNDENSEEFGESRFFEIFGKLESPEEDACLLLQQINEIITNKNYKFITESFILKVNLIEILPNFINESVPFTIQQQALLAISNLLHLFPNLISKLFENDLISLILEVIQKSSDTSTNIIAFQILIEATKSECSHAFFESDDFIKFLANDAFSKPKYEFQISALLSECLRFVNFNNVKCLQKLLHILIKTIGNNSAIRVETQLKCMKGILNFVERGNKQQRFLTKCSVIEALTEKLSLLSLQAKIIYFRIIQKIFENEDKKLLSKFSSLQQTPLFIDNISIDNNELSIAVLNALSNLLERFPLFASAFSSTRLCEFLTMTLEEKVFEQKKAAVVLIKHIVMDITREEIVERYMNDTIIGQLISLSEDESEDSFFVKNVALDILYVFVNSCNRSEHDLYDDMYQALVDNDRITDDDDGD